MKRFSLALVLSLMVVTTLFAQPKGAPRRGDNPQPMFSIEEFLKQKCDAIVHELGLTAADSARFVPVYRELQAQKGQLYHRFGGARQVRHAVAQGENVADTTLMRVIENNARLQVEDAKLELQFIERFAKVLSPMQLYQLQQAEKKYKSEMLKRAKPMKK